MPATSYERTKASRLRRRATLRPLDATEAEWLDRFTSRQKKDAEGENASSEPNESEAVDAEAMQKLDPLPVGRSIALKSDAQIAGVIDAARRSAEAGVTWMERACAQFESIARIATERAVQTERELVSALSGLASATSAQLEQEHDDDAPAASPDAGLDGLLMQELLGALQKSRNPPAE